MLPEQAGVAGESQQGPKLTIRLGWSEQGGLGRTPPGRDGDRGEMSETLLKVGKVRTHSEPVGDKGRS